VWHSAPSLSEIGRGLRHWFAVIRAESATLGNMPSSNGITKKTPNPRVLRTIKRDLERAKRGELKTVSHTQLLRDCLTRDAARART
jgi:hypothetical protein